MKLDTSSINSLEKNTQATVDAVTTLSAIAAGKSIIRPPFVSWEVDNTPLGASPILSGSKACAEIAQNLIAIVAGSTELADCLQIKFGISACKVLALGFAEGDMAIRPLDSSAFKWLTATAIALNLAVKAEPEIHMKKSYYDFFQKRVNVVAGAIREVINCKT
ncbi:MAG: hypothetical protein ACHP6I_01935 [Rickettsiales bacterium]